jgi:hypothetical protein
MAAARGGLALAALLGLALGRVAASCPSTEILGNKYIDPNIPGDLPGGEMPPGDVNLVVVDWEACFMEPGPETCPTVKVAPGDYVFFKWTQYHDVAFAPSNEAYESCSGSFENVSGPVTRAGGSYMLRVPEDAPTEELYVVCSVRGHCTMGQKLVIDVSQDYACKPGDDDQEEDYEPDTDTEDEDDTDTEDEDDTDTEDEDDTDTEDEDDTDTDGEGGDEGTDSGVVIDAQLSGDATMTIGNTTYYANATETGGE